MSKRESYRQPQSPAQDDAGRDSRFQIFMNRVTEKYPHLEPSGRSSRGAVGTVDRPRGSARSHK